MGAGHYAVAARLLKQAVAGNPDNLLLLNLLAEAQMQNLEYRNAEATLQKIAQADQENGESYFNLARFYLTASYKPDMARKCAIYARSLRPEDARIGVMLALLDYAEGNIDAGLSRMHELLPRVEDPAFKAICQRIINDGQYADDAKETKFDFIEILALPGAAHAAKSSYGLLATEYLQKGSYFSALRYFLMAQDIAEVGRTYLGFSSALNMAGEKQTSAVAAGYGLRALNEHLGREPDAARANLYLALYHFERDEFALADRAVKSGLHGNADRGTRQRLTALLNSLAAKKKLSN
jgi:tetratricopeptide (TPR) repeat protein